MWPFRRFSFMVRLWLRRVYTDFGFRWRRVRRPARPRAGRRAPLGVERLETIEAANNLLPLFGAMASIALVAATPAGCDTGTWTIAAPVDDSAEVLDSTNTTLAQRTDEATVAADQVFLTMTDDTAAAFSQPLAPVNTDPLAQQPDDGLTGDPANPPTGGNGAFARPLSGANAQGQAAQGSSGLTNTPHMPTVNANAPSGAPAPLAAAPSGPAGLIGGTGSAPTAGTTTNTTSASTASPATTSGAVPAGHGHGGSPQGGIVALDSLQPEPTVQFTQTSFITPEGTQTLLTVDLSASSTQTVTVQYATADGTAQAGVDYTNTSGTLTFNPGTTTQTITVPGLDDAGSGESGETFTVALSSPTNATLGSANLAMVSITEDSEGGSQPTVQFQQSSYNYAEGAQATVGVSLSAASSQSVTVKYTTADNTALAGTDYTTTSGYLTFNPGTTDEYFTVPLLDDGGSGESGENFSVSLYSAVNATLGTPSTIPVNITEDSDGGGGGAPVANNDAYSFVHDATASVSAATGVLANDSGGPPLSAVLYEPPDHGTLSLHSDGSFTYAPNAGYVGTDAFGYRASDGTQYSNVATVSLTITDANAPVAVADSYSVLHDQVLNVDSSSGVLANDSDADNDALTAALVLGQNPAHGSLAFAKDGSFVYTPDAGYVGSDSFQYTASDGALASAATTVTLSVTDQAPVVQGHSYGVQENTPLTMTAPGLLSGASDADGDALTASLVPNQGPQHGTATVNADGSFTYTPTSGYTGSDSFQYQAGDGALSSSATVTLTVHAAGTAPTASADSYTLLHDQAYSTTAATGVLANDTPGTPGDVLTASLVSGQGPTHGNLTFNTDGSFTYTPSAGYVGSDSFQYEANEGTLSSSATTVSLTINDPNAPVAVADSYNVERNNPLAVDTSTGVLANDTDADSDPLTASLVSGQGPTNGTLSFNSDGSFTYTPNSNFTGTDSFQYTANDGVLASAATTVTLTVTGSPPVANDDAFSVQQNTTLTAPTGALTVNDYDPDGLPFTSAVATGPAHGSVTVHSDGSFTYIPTTGYVGSDSFTYTDSDGSLVSSPATVNITVTASNTLPTASNVSYTANHDVPLNVPATGGVLYGASDPDGDPLLATLVTGPTHGTLTLNTDGSFVYTPTAGYYGSDSFTFQAFDGTGYSNTATASITVAETAPVANSDLYNVAVGTPLTADNTTGVLTNDTDAEGDPLSASLVTGPTYGTLTLNSDGSFTYTPGDSFPGSDSFAYTASDGILTSNTATVTLSTAPVAQDNSYSVNHDTPLTVDSSEGALHGASDADGDPLTATLVSQPTNGTLSLNSDGSFTYTPNYHFVGTDSFTYHVSDGSYTSSTATATIDVTNNSPEAGDMSFSTTENTALNVSPALGVLSNSSDPENDPLTAQLVSGPSHGTLTLGSGGQVVYTPNANWYGTDSFTFTVSDGLLVSNTATATVEVNPVISFTQPNSLPSAIVAGDFNGDGNLDLAVADKSLNTVTVELGDGTGSVTPGQVISVGTAPVALATGDFLGNSRLDLAVANSGSNTVSILVNNGSGTFTTATTLTGFNDPVALAVGDFNGDGKKDLAVVNEGSNTVSILTGNGDGTFTAQMSLTTGSSPTGIATAEFNGDGHADLVVTNSASNTVSVFLGNGNGTFGAAQMDAVGTDPISVVTGDFNADGLVDVAVANTGSNNVSVLLGNGDGTFQAATNYAAGSSPQSLVTGDISGSGMGDLVVANPSTHTITYLLNAEDGTFEDPVSEPTPSSDTSLALGDFNNDGQIDVAMSYSDPGEAIYLGLTAALPGQPAAAISGLAKVGLDHFDDWITQIRTYPGYRLTFRLTNSAITQLFTQTRENGNQSWIDNKFNAAAAGSGAQADAMQQAAAITVLYTLASTLRAQAYDFIVVPWLVGVTNTALSTRCSGV